MLYNDRLKFIAYLKLVLVHMQSVADLKTADKPCLMHYNSAAAQLMQIVFLLLNFTTQHVNVVVQIT